MGDVLSKVLMGILGCIILFLVPPMLISVKQDTVTQNRIDSQVVRFGDNACTSGKITPSAYLELCDAIDSAGVICEIKITHSSAYTVPSDTPDPDTGLYKPITYRMDYIKEDITSYMFPDSGDNLEYQMKNGDYLAVQVINTSPSLGTRMVRLFSNKINDVTLFSNYGNMVGNNMQ